MTDLKETLAFSFQHQDIAELIEEEMRKRELMDKSRVRCDCKMCVMVNTWDSW